MGKSFIFAENYLTMERKKLHEVATLVSGVFKKSTTDNPDAAYIQLSDIKDGSIVSDLPKRVKLEQGSKHLLQNGDILLVVKGEPMAVTYLRSEEETTPAMASTTFAVIRVLDRSQISPQYLRWWLNSSYSKEFYDQQSRGSSLKVLSLKHLKDLEVNIPSLEYQEHFIRLQEAYSTYDKSRIAILKKTQEFHSAKLEHLIGILE